jgi:chemotaxis signal transduction protein
MSVAARVSLGNRCVVYSVAPIPSPMDDARSRYLVVRLADRALALPVDQVIEVCRVPVLQTGKGEAPGLLGLAMLRGLPTAVLNLSELLGWTGPLQTDEQAATTERNRRLINVRMQAADTTGRNAVLVANAAFLVDEVIGVHEFSAAGVETIALPGGQTQRIGEFDQQFVRLIDHSGLVPESAWQQIAEATR